MRDFEKQTLGREEWVKIGLETLKHHSPDNLRVTTLAKRLGVTSGSFYWHFADLAEFW